MSDTDVCYRPKGYCCLASCDHPPECDHDGYGTEETPWREMWRGGEVIKERPTDPPAVGTTGGQQMSVIADEIDVFNLFRDVFTAEGSLDDVFEAVRDSYGVEHDRAVIAGIL